MHVLRRSSVTNNAADRCVVDSVCLDLWTVHTQSQSLASFAAEQKATQILLCSLEYGQRGGQHVFIAAALDIYYRFFLFYF